MTTYRDTVEILIAARDEATRELKGIRREVAATRDDLAEGRGAAGAALKLHGALLKVGAAAEVIKSSMAGVRALTQAIDGDAEGAVESAKQLGFGIGEIVNQADMLFDVLGNKIYGVTQQLLDLETERARRHEQMVAAQIKGDQAAASARESMLKMDESFRRQLLLLKAGTDEERKQLELQLQHQDRMEAIEKLRRQAVRDRSIDNQLTGEMMADFLQTTSESVLQQQQLLILEEKRRENHERITQEVRQQYETEKRRREEGERRLIELDRQHNRDAQENTRGAIGRLREELSSLAGRSRTIALGDQGGRFASGLRDALSRREDPIIEERRRQAEFLNGRIEQLEKLLRELNEQFKKIGQGGVELVPLKINGGGNF